jgi:hypothetical protein
MRTIILSLVAAGAGSCAHTRESAPAKPNAPASSSAATATPAPGATPEFPALLEVSRVQLLVRDAPVDDLYERITFHVIENGANDLIYVGVKYGMWSDGEFDLRKFEKLIYTGHIEHLINEDVLINMGDVLPKPTGGLRVTRVTGWFK